MLNNISWASYVYALSIILVIYYFLVLLLFYRNEVKSYYRNSNGKKFLTSNSNPSIKPVASETITESVEVNSIEKLLSSLLLTIKKAASQHLIKEELLQSLKVQIQFYAGRVSSLPKEKINNYIMENIETYCSIHLNVEDMELLWKNGG